MIERASLSKWAIQFLEAHKLIIMLALILAYAGSIVHVYTTQIVDDLSSGGLKAWHMSIVGWVGVSVGLPYLAWSIARIDGRPSDFFRLLYGVIALVAFILLHPVWGVVPMHVVAAGLAILVAPLLILEALRQLNPIPLMNIQVKKVLEPTHIEAIVAVIVLGVMCAGYLNPTLSAGFGLSDIYVRRLEGRTIYPDRSLLAYGLAMSMNGFAPYLAFRAGLRIRADLMMMAMAAVVFFYWLLGVKAPLLYVIVSAMLGLAVRKNGLRFMAYFCLGVTIVLWMAVLTDRFFGINNQAVANYFFLRVYAVQAELQVMYVKFLFDPKLISWSWLTGSSDPFFAATYYIGEHYTGNADQNANTNAFLYQFAAKGVIGYLGAALFVPFFLVILDSLWRASRNPSFLFLGFLYGLLVVEQAYTVAMISSGVGVLFLLAVLEKMDSMKLTIKLR